MQVFRCPFCGPRPETEFLYGGEAGRARPEPAETVSEADWAAFLYHNDNPRGRSREVCLHVTCETFFVMERDTLTHEVFGSAHLPGAEP